MEKAKNEFPARINGSITAGALSSCRLYVPQDQFGEGRCNSSLPSSAMTVRRDSDTSILDQLNNVIMGQLNTWTPIHCRGP